MISKTKLMLCSSVFALSAPLAALAQQGCDQYAQNRGTDLAIDAAGNLQRIMFTASVGVTFDDINAINDAKDEATLEAKSGIAKFLNEDIRSDESINRAITSSTTMTGQQKQDMRTETTNKLKNLSSSSGALLRGVVVLGDCYTKGKEVRVTVGLKPETIAAAGSLAGQMGGSPAGGQAPQQAPQGGQAPAPQMQNQPLNGMNNSNNSNRVRNF